jgi:hypothetical protein
MPIIVEKRIATGADDVEQRASGSMSLTGTDLELGVDGSTVQSVGLRFTGLDIPWGAIITSAYIQFQTDEVKTGTTSLQIRGEDTGDAAAFTSASFNLTSRQTTDAAASWSPGAWTTVGEAGLAPRTPDLTAIVHEIVGRSDWAALNDMAFVISGTGTRTAEAYEGGATRAPLLHVEYTVRDDGAVGAISIDDVTVIEGDAGATAATFTVTRSGGNAPFTVDYAMADDSATAGIDYVASSGTLSFAVGQTTQTISATINGDTAIEPTETFFVNLSGNTNITDGVGVGTIANDDTAPIQPVVRNIWDTTALGSP